VGGSAEGTECTGVVGTAWGEVGGGRGGLVLRGVMVGCWVHCIEKGSKDRKRNEGGRGKTGSEHKLV